MATLTQKQVFNKHRYSYYKPPVNRGAVLIMLSEDAWLRIDEEKRQHVPAGFKCFIEFKGNKRFGLKGVNRNGSAYISKII